MRNYVLGSIAGHVLVLLLGSWVSMSTQAAPEFDTIRVDLAQLDLPEPESSRPKEPEPEPEPPPIPDPPREVVTRPPETVPETMPDVPEPEPQLDLVPPDPELPREPEPPPPPEPEPPVQEVLDLPEPEVVKPEPPPPEPAEPEETMVETEPEEVSESASVQMSAPQGVDDYYLALVQRKIGRRWEPTAASARGHRDVKAIVAFRIGPAGEILTPAVTESSGLSVFDRQALRAVMSADPVPAPPPRFRRSGLNIRFTFIYNP